MPIRVANVPLPLDGDEGEVLAAALRRAGIRAEDAASVAIVRKSLDRRDRRPRYACVVEIRLRDEAPASEAEPPRKAGETPMEHPPVIVGAGPAGLFAALILSREGYRPVVLERGDAMNHRAGKIRDFNRHGALDSESNYLFGEGGAGTWSDGKLTSRSKDPRANFVLDLFREMSGVDDVRVFYRPHLGSDRIRAVTGRLRREILERGGRVLFRTRAESLRIEQGRVRAVATTAGEIPADEVVLAPGHSARAFVRSLAAAGVAVERKPFQLGFRVEHSQKEIDRAVYGAACAPGGVPADYRIAAGEGRARVFSFCMCPGGEIIAAVSDLGFMNTNGMSYSKKDSGFANSGLVTTIEPEMFEGDPADPFAGVALQERFEALAAEAAARTARVPAQRLNDFLAGRPSADLPSGSCRTGFAPADLARLAPPFVVRAMRSAAPVLARQLRGFLSHDALLVGPEARSSSPVRLLRHAESCESTTVRGLRPVGEGAGYAGGIVSAAVDGIRAAEAILQLRARPSRE